MLCGEARMKRGRKGRKRRRGIDTRGKIAHRAKKAEEGRNKVGLDAEGGQGEEMSFSGDAAPMEPETKSAERRKGRSPGEGSQEHRGRETAEAGGDGKGCRKWTQKLRGGR